MPSFASQVKNELVHVLGSQVCCKTAELAALLRMGATISFNSKHDFGINFVTENAAVARKILTLLKASVPQGIHTEVTVRRSRRLRKHNNYAVRATPSPEASSILKRLGFLTAKNLLDAGTDRNILQNDCCKIAYLRGAFLGGGSVNKPEGEYHLEFVTDNYTFAKLIRDLCHELYLPVGLTDRKIYIVYLKESEAILELLALIGVEESLLQAFESARNLKEIRNQVNRLVNCETANLQRTINAAMKQIENINLLIKYDEYDELPKVLKQTANLRLNNPEASLTELAELLNCSRSAINHRMRKIDALAMQIRKDNSIEE